jgi:cytosine/adenosine deaminase-related metal-dependent hydrolase
LRASLCYEVTDRDGPTKAQAGIAENVRFIERVRQEHPAGGRLAAMFGLHASLTLSEKTLEACHAAIPSHIGFHVHVAESIADEYDSLQKSGKRIVDRLNEHGILGERTIAAHAVNVDMREAEQLAQTNTWVTHQPRSNMNNAVGVAPVEDFLRLGIRVCLGNDGFLNAMWEEWKTAYLVHKLYHRDPRRMNGYDLAQIAIYNNASLANQLFPDAPLGIIQKGAVADLIFVDYQPFTDLTPGNLPWHILFGFHESMVTTTIVAGKVLMHQRELLTLNEAEVAAQAREVSARVWKRYQAQFA